MPGTKYRNLKTDHHYQIPGGRMEIEKTVQVGLYMGSFRNKAMYRAIRVSNISVEGRCNVIDNFPQDLKLTLQT